MVKTPIQFTMPRTRPQDTKDKEKREEEEQEEEEQGTQGTRYYYGGGYYGGGYYNYYPVTVTHSTYHSMYHGLGSAHPGHFHGVGGFAG